MYTKYMADTSLNEDRLGLLVWQTSNIWQSNLRKIIKNYQLSLNEYFIIDRSRVTPMIEDRDHFYFDKISLSRIKRNDKLKKYYNFIKCFCVSKRG